MVKNANKPSVKHGKPITEFFTRSTKPSAAPQGVPSLSVGTIPLLKSSSNPKGPIKGSETDEKVAEGSNTRTTVSKLPTKHASYPNSERVDASSRKSGSSQAFLKPPTSSPGSLKRSLSPESSNRATTPNELHPTSIKSPHERRRNKFESDSEAENPPSVIFVNSKSGIHTKKKPRLSSPLVDSVPEVPSLVPSSQSDEEDLPSIQMQSNFNETLSNNGLTRTGSTALDGEEDIHMQSDDEVFDDLSSLSPSSSGDMDQSTSPSLSGPSSVPPTPVALDRDSKTAKIIAEIKERAYAKALSSPEAAPLKFEEMLSSSSEEENFLPTKPIKSNSIQKSSAFAIRRSSRNQAKARPLSPSLGSRPRASSSRISPTLKIHTKEKTKATTHVPFEGLLKERKLAVKRGEDENAVRRAETTVLKITRDGLLNEMDEEDDVNAWDVDDVLQDSQSFIDRLTSPDSNNSPGSNKDLGEETRKTLFGKRDGKGALDVLKQDRAVQRHDELAAKRSGINFWSNSHTASNYTMSVDDTSFPELDGKNFLRAAMLLDNNFMSSISSLEHILVAPSLYDLAFSLSSHFEVLSKSAFHALEQFWISSTTSVISFSQVLRTLQSLGADPSILSFQNWTLDDATRTEDVSNTRRNDLIQRLLVLINCCARRLRQEDAADMIVILLLIGMDSETSSTILRDIVQVIDQAARCISSDHSVSLDLESVLCSKILKSVGSYDPINKARLVSILSSGSGPIRRVANFVAYCIVTDKSNSQLEIYSDAPPLIDVIGELVPYSKSSSSTPGKFAIHEQTDYVDLGFYITILSIAVSNLRSYTAQEREHSSIQRSIPLRPGSPTKRGEKVKTDLQLLHNALESLHSNIADTRATHLERSRTKAIIKGLAMNIHYQRDGWLKNDAHNKAKTLAQYFTKKDNP